MNNDIICVKFYDSFLYYYFYFMKTKIFLTLLIVVNSYSFLEESI